MCVACMRKYGICITHTHTHTHTHRHVRAEKYVLIFQEVLLLFVVVTYILAS
jgi:hypothetical protein